MNDVQVGRYSALLHKLLEISEGTPTPTLAPELFAMIGLEVDRPEWHFLSGGKICEGYAVESSAVGARSIVALINPTGSDCLCVIDQMHALASQVYLIMEATYATSFAAFDSDGTTRVVDFRAGIAGIGYNLQTTCKIKTDTRAVLSAAFNQWWPHFETSTNEKVFREDSPIVLPPNCGIAITGSTDNNTVRASFRWRERHLEKMELQGVNPRIS